MKNEHLTKHTRHQSLHFGVDSSSPVQSQGGDTCTHTQMLLFTSYITCSQRFKKVQLEGFWSIQIQKKETKLGTPIQHCKVLEYNNNMNQLDVNIDT